MILMESAAKIRRLVLRDGRSIRSVSRSTGLSRNTVKKYLNDATPPRYQRSQPPVRHKLQGFEERLRSLFEQDQNPYLPRANAGTTSAASYMCLMAADAP